MAKVTTSISLAKARRICKGDLLKIDGIGESYSLAVSDQINCVVDVINVHSSTFYPKQNVNNYLVLPKGFTLTLEQEA